MSVDTTGNNILLAAQIFGYAGNLFSASKQVSSINRMTELDQAAIGIRMQQETLQATQESLASTERLQEVLSSQRAIAGARGQALSPALANKAIKTAGQERQNINLAKDYNIYQAKAQQTLVGLNGLNQKQNIYSKLAAQSFNNTSLNDLYKLKGWNEQETVK
jgi:hypothetical protein